MSEDDRRQLAEKLHSVELSYRFLKKRKTALKSEKQNLLVQLEALRKEKNDATTQLQANINSVNNNSAGSTDGNPSRTSPNLRFVLLHTVVKYIIS